MNQRRRIEKAIALLDPVKVSVAQRAPAGMTKGQADQILLRVANACECLRITLGFYDRVADRRAS